MKLSFPDLKYLSFFHGSIFYCTHTSHIWFLLCKLSSSEANHFEILYTRPSLISDFTTFFVLLSCPLIFKKTHSSIFWLPSKSALDSQLYLFSFCLSGGFDIPSVLISCFIIVKYKYFKVCFVRKYSF